MGKEFIVGTEFEVEELLEKARLGIPMTLEEAEALDDLFGLEERIEDTEAFDLTEVQQQYLQYTPTTLTILDGVSFEALVKEKRQINAEMLIFDVIDFRFDEEGNAIIQASSYNKAFAFARHKNQQGKVGNWYWKRLSGRIDKTEENPTGIQGTKLAENETRIKLFKNDLFYLQDIYPRSREKYVYEFNQSFTPGKYRLEIKSAHRDDEHRFEITENSDILIDFTDNEFELATMIDIVEIDPSEERAPEKTRDPESTEYFEQINHLYHHHDGSMGDLLYRLIYVMNGFNAKEQKLLINDRETSRRVLLMFYPHSLLKAIAKWNYPLQKKLEWSLNAKGNRSNDALNADFDSEFGNNYYTIRECVFLSDKSGFKPDQWINYFAEICDEHTIHEAVEDLGLNAEDKKKYIEAVGSDRQPKVYDDLRDTRSPALLTDDYEKIVKKLDNPDLKNALDAYNNYVKAYQDFRRKTGYQRERSEDIIPPYDERELNDAEKVLKQRLEKLKKGTSHRAWHKSKESRAAASFELYMKYELIHKKFLVKFEEQAQSIVHSVLDLSAKHAQKFLVLNDEDLTNIEHLIEKNIHITDKEGRAKAYQQYPILLAEGLEYRRVLNQLKRGDNERMNAKMYLEYVSSNVLASIDIVRDKLRNPEENQVWKLPEIMQATKEHMGTTDVMNFIINQKIRAANSMTWFEVFYMLAEIAAGVLAMVFSSGTAGFIFLATGIGLSVGSTKMAYDEYQFEKAKEHTHIIKAKALSQGDASLFWVYVSAVGIALDAASLFKVVRAARSMPSGSLVDDADLAHYRKAITEMSDELGGENIVKQLIKDAENELEVVKAARKQYRVDLDNDISDAWSQLGKVTGLGSSGFTGDSLEAIGNIIQGYVKKGASKFQDVITNLKHDAKVKGLKNIDFDNLTDKDVQKLKRIFEEAKEKSDELYGVYRGKKVKVESSRIDFANAHTADELQKIDSWPKRPRSNEPVAGGFEHTLDQHFSRPLANSRSIFSITPEKLKSIIKSSQVINSKLIDAGGGIYYRIVDTGMNVGNSALKFGGKETSYIKVFTDVKGVYINAYPVPKP